MARNEQLIRQHKTLQILERYRFGRTLEEIRDELVEELGLGSLHTRSVRRDLEALQTAGFDVDVHSIGRGRVWKLGPLAKSTHKVTVTATELMALSLGRDLLVPLAGTPFWQGIESFWNKIRKELPEPVWKSYQKYRRTLHVAGLPTKQYADKLGMMKTVNRAIVEHRCLEIEYQPPGRPVARRHVEPYAVVVYQSSLYIVAALASKTDEPVAMRHWKLDRFHRATLLDEWFQVREDFDVTSYLGESIGIFTGKSMTRFRIWISPKAATWVLEDPWCPQQEVKQRRDGSLELVVRASHPLEVIPRVLALGTEAELLAPASCRSMIAELTQSMADRYRTD